MHHTSPSISALITLLQTQQARFAAFLALLQREQDAIKSLASSSLVELSQAKLILLEELRGLEEQRAAVVDGIAGHWGVRADSLTLRAIAERVGSLEADMLLCLHERLNTVVQAVRRATSFNGELIARSLAFLNEGLGVWHSVPTASSLYSSHGGLKPGHHQGTLVRQQG